MRNIYKGPMRGLVVSKLELNNGVIKTLEYETPVIKKDLLFYRGRLNSFISFDYETIMPDQLEALDFIKNIAIQHNITEGPYPFCNYVNPGEIKFSHQVTKEEFKAIKKQYRQKRKIKRMKKK